MVVVTLLAPSTPGKYRFRVTEGGHTCLIERNSRPERLAPSYGAILSAIEAARKISANAPEGGSGFPP